MPASWLDSFTNRRDDPVPAFRVAGQRRTSSDERTGGPVTDPLFMLLHPLSQLSCRKGVHFGLCSRKSGNATYRLTPSGGYEAAPQHKRAEV